MENKVVNAGSPLRMENRECYAKESLEIKAENENTMVRKKIQALMSLVPFFITKKLKLTKYKK